MGRDEVELGKYGILSAGSGEGKVAGWHLYAC